MDTEHAGRFVKRLWWVVGMILALLALLVGESILTSRHQHEEQAVVETYSVARVLESDIGGLVNRVGLALRMVATVRERFIAGAPGEQAAALRADVAGIRQDLPEVSALRVADERGQWSFVTEFASAPLAPVGDWAVFRHLRDRSESGVAVALAAAPVAEGETEVAFARRVEYPDGRFAGVVVATVPAARLATMLSAAEVGANGAVALWGEDLSLIARYPSPGGGPAASVPPEMRRLVTAGEITGTFQAASSVDGIERLYSYRRVAGHPLHITVGRASSEYLGHWRRDMGLVAALAVVLFAMAIGITVVTDRAWRRLQRAAFQLEKQAHTDALTGLANRRHFFEKAEAELQRARRYDAPLALLMLDIDHFKDVNDAHGHRAGDRVLQALARTCREVLRSVDVVGRVGGEEFAILLPETPVADAADVAGRLRAAVAATRIGREEGVPLSVTVSIGVAALEPGVNLDTLMSRADTALYDAKHQGRDRVCTYGAGRSSAPVAAGASR